MFHLLRHVYVYLLRLFPSDDSIEAMMSSCASSRTLSGSRYGEASICLSILTSHCLLLLPAAFSTLCFIQHHTTLSCALLSYPILSFPILCYLMLAYPLLSYQGAAVCLSAMTHPHPHRHTIRCTAIYHTLKRQQHQHFQQQ